MPSPRYTVRIPPGWTRDVHTSREAERLAENARAAGFRGIELERNW